MKHFGLVTVIAISIGTQALAGANTDNSFEVFKKVCLTKPFNPDANLAAVKAIGVVRFKEIADGWWGFDNQPKGFGGTIKKSRKGHECFITSFKEANWKKAAKSVATKVSKLKGYQGVDEKKVKRVTRLKYRGGIIWITKTRGGGVGVGITNSTN